MASGTVHVVGAGIAGLSVATLLAADGRSVVLYDSAGHAGGRCRSFHDDSLDRVVDNGNHLILNGNQSVLRYVERIGTTDRIETAPRAAFPFVDMADGTRWALDLGAGKGVPGTFWHFLAHGHGIPGCSRLDLRTARRFRDAGLATVADQMGAAGTIYQRLWEPLSVAVLNTEPEEAMASAMWPVLEETLGQGADACRPVMVPEGLGSALVDPALEYLTDRDVRVCFNAQLRDIECTGDQVDRLHFTHETVSMAPDDLVVLALPIAGVNSILPEIETPTAYRPIVNAHFLLPGKIGKLTILGLINAKTQWVFRRGDVASVTVSAATDLIDQPSDAIAEVLWRDVVEALSLQDVAMGRFRVIKEKRATFAQTPEQNRRRPSTETRFDNLYLAGDWIQTGLPATLEGAVRSGEKVVDGIMKN